MVISAAINPVSAILQVPNGMLLADKMEELIRIQVEAVKNIKIDKITVWDGGSKDGSSTTANFASNLMKSIPPMNDLFKMAGMDLPKYLGEDAKPVVEPKPEPKK